MTIATSDVTTDPQNVASENLDTRHNDGELVSWVMSRVLRWRTTRDSNYFDLWDQYWSIWRGQWNAKLKQRDSERSRLISPATQQAVDATVSEMVEATFGRGDWFDIDQDAQDDPQLKQEAEQARDNLVFDFTRDKIQHAVVETYINGAIYGTGVAKRIVESKSYSEVSSDKYGNPQEDPREATCVYWQAIPPYNFVIDTAALTIDDALGVAHETIRPIDEIERKQRDGEYFTVPIGSASGYATGIIARGPKGENLEVNILDATYITEYHGRVPKKFFDEEDEDTPLAPYAIEDISDQRAQPMEMVEAIVIIANGNALLQKKLNPFPNGDRGFVAYQHDRVPNRFWGRGVVEKAYNAQIALDAELRARIDAMALMAYPVVGFDATRLPRNLNLQIKPGKGFLVNGDPETIIRPIQFGQISPEWFQQSGDLERMVSLATGTYDPGSDGNPAANASAASAASMSLGAMIKRAKLTMQTVDVDFLQPLIKKSYLAYQVLNPQRYPKNQIFKVNTSMSIMAREFEQTQMTNLLAIVPPQTPAFYVILKAIAENYSGPSREQLVSSIDQMAQPNPQQQQMQQQMQQIQMQGAMAEVQKLLAEVEKLKAEPMLTMAKTHEASAKAQAVPVQTAIEAAQMHMEGMKTGIGAAEAQHARISTALDHVQHHKDHVHDVTKLAMEHHHKKMELAQEKQKADDDRAMEENQREKDRAVMEKMGASQMTHESEENTKDRKSAAAAGTADRRSKEKIASMKPASPGK